EGVAVQVHDRAIADAVRRNVGMAMYVAAINAVRLASRVDLVTPNAGHVLRFLWMNRWDHCRSGSGGGEALLGKRFGSASQPAHGDGEVARPHGGRPPAAIVAGVGEVDVALPVALGRRAHVISAARVGQLDRSGPAVAEPGRGVNVPAALNGPAIDA